MTAKLSHTLLVGALLVACSVPARGQDQEQRHGAWAAVGIGYGSATSSCDGCSAGGRAGGLSFSGFVGGTPNSRVQVGLGADFWAHSLGADSLERIDDFLGLIRYHPHPGGDGPFAEAGFGWSYYRVDKGTSFFSGDFGSHPDSTYLSGTGWALRLGAGVEHQAGQGRYGALRLVYEYGHVGALSLPGGAIAVTGWTQSMLRLEFVVSGTLW